MNLTKLGRSIFLVCVLGIIIGLGYLLNNTILNIAIIPYAASILFLVVKDIIKSKIKKPSHTLGKLNIRPSETVGQTASRTEVPQTPEYFTETIPYWAAKDIRNATGYDPVTGEYLTEKEDKLSLKQEKEKKNINQGIHAPEKPAPNRYDLLKG